MSVEKLVPLVKLAIDVGLPQWKRDQKALRVRVTEATAQAIARHHTNVVEWSQATHTLQGADALRTDTVALSFDAVPRRLRFDTSRHETVGEADLLFGDRHIAVTGDPGAGKTTTLRRIAAQVAHAPETRPDDDFTFVVLVVCREERWEGKTLLDVLAEKVGISGKLAADLDDPEGRLLQVLDCNALVLIDGLDEVPSEVRNDMFFAVERLGRHIARSKVIVTCRSADYRPLETFSEAEILPLSRPQMRKAIEAVLGDEEATAFFAAVDAPGHPAGELAGRPLFLNQMAVLYRLRGTIPERPSDLCAAIVRLIIQEWDEQRGVRRASAYAQFGLHEKERFLADLALALTKSHVTFFLEQELERAYVDLAPRYDLPKAEARAVARELESHTGLFVKRGIGFEFSHLSLQEYLAADSLIRSAGAASQSWWTGSTAITAVATALSSTPSEWLAARLREVPDDLRDVQPLHSLLHRIADERPRFTRHPPLGEEFLRVCFRARVDSVELGSRLHHLRGLRMSIFEAMRRTRVSTGGNRTSIRFADRELPSVGVRSDFLRAVLGADLYRDAVRTSN